MKKLFLKLFLSILVCHAAEAQFKSILLDPADAYEPSVAINRVSVQNIVASSAPDNIYVTNNGGFSWEKIKLTSSFGVSGNLVVVTDFKGNFYCLHLSDHKSKKQLVIQESSDGGKTWSQGALISNDTSRCAVNPKAAMDRKGNFFVTWTDFANYKSDDENCISRVMLSRSSNGKKWSKPLELSQTNGNCKDDDLTPSGAMPAVMGDGQRAFAAWANHEKIFFDRAFDGGNTWLTNDISILEQAGGWRINIPGVKDAHGMPMLLCNNTRKSALTGELCIVWSDQVRGENDTDVWFTRSLNFGDNWNEPIRVNNDGPAKHQYFPYMALDSETGFIYIIYYDRRNYIDTTTDVYIAYSEEGGSNFKNVKISETPFVADESVVTGNYIGLSAYAGIITPVWIHTENGKSSVVISVIKHEELKAAVKP